MGSAGGDPLGKRLALGPPMHLCCSRVASLKKLFSGKESDYCVRGRQRNSCERTPAAGAGFRLCVLQLRQRNSGLAAKCRWSPCGSQLFPNVQSSPRSSEPRSLVSPINC